MKLDATDLRYITSDEFRVLTAVEIGSKNHEVVPTPLIVQISGLRNGGVNKLIGSLAQRNLVAKVQNAKYDGYRLTYGGYDYLAMRAMSKRDSMFSVGNQIGVGKESDIYVVADLEGNEMVLKLHRLGRVSFRAIKQKRDYLGKRKSASWMYMSRLAAQKEWAFMKVLHEHNFPVPRPIDQARHCILMEFIDAYPLRQVSEIASPGELYSKLMDLIVRLAQAGLIHGDFNEFNILIRRETGEPVVIDFPQMVSTSHANAEWYFNRDVECIRTFFKRRFRYESALYPRFKSTIVAGGDKPQGSDFRLDVVVAASGFKNNDMRTLEQYMEAIKLENNRSEEEAEHEDEEYSEEDEDEDDEVEQLETEDDSSAAENKPGCSRVMPPGDSDNVERSRIKLQLGLNIPSPTGSDVGRGRTRGLSEDDEAFKLPSPTLEGRPLSRSPPRSRSPSPETLEKMMASLSMSARRNEVKDIVSSDIARARARQQRKYHSKRGAQRAGRPKGSKAKQDSRVTVDRSGLWE